MGPGHRYNDQAFSHVQGSYLTSKSIKSGEFKNKSLVGKSGEFCKQKQSNHLKSCCNTPIPFFIKIMSYNTELTVKIMNSVWKFWSGHFGLGKVGEKGRIVSHK